MSILPVLAAAALSTPVASMLPRLACRLSVAAGKPLRSYCPHCRQPFAPGRRGWLRLGAPCETCNHGAWRWWTVAAMVAATSGALAWRMGGTTAAEIALLVMWLLIVQAGTLLSLIDVAVYRLPTTLVAGTGLLVVIGTCLAVLLGQHPRWLLFAALGASGLGGWYLMMALLLPGAVGMGDVRLAAVLGAALGTAGLPTLLLGAVLAYVVALPFALTQRWRQSSDRHGQVPFGPFLMLGAVVAILVLPA